MSTPNDYRSAKDMLGLIADLHLELQEAEQDLNTTRVGKLKLELNLQMEEFNEVYAGTGGHKEFTLY